MRILHVATELHPLLKVGGLGDVLAALPREQIRQGHRARVLLPGLPPILAGLALPEPVSWPGEGRILAGLGPWGLPLFVLEHPAFHALGRNPYEGEGAPALARHRLLAEAAFHLARQGAGEWVPEVVHVHDWPTALLPALLAFREVSHPPTVLTIHNAAYQGLFPAEAFPALDLPLEAFTPDGLEFHGQVNLLKAGVRFADRLCTVSPTYAAELLQPEGGMGLEGLFRTRSSALTGILNGIDLDQWDPQRDAHLAAPYGPSRLERRSLNKGALQAEAGLDPDAFSPLFAVVSRLDPQKGLDLLLDDLGILLELGAQLLVLGQGEASLAEGFRWAAEETPGRVAFVEGLHEGLAHRIFAGADFILVPSRWEPCGLTQLYAMRYGALPIVRRTGGLADTVVDLDAGQPGEAATGLVFERATRRDLGEALRRACELRHWEQRRMRRAQEAGMARDAGWSGPAKAYEGVYESLLVEA